MAAKWLIGFVANFGKGNIGFGFDPILNDLKHGRLGHGYLVLARKVVPLHKLLKVVRALVIAGCIQIQK